MSNRTSPFAFDWWIIQKRFIYLMIAFLVLRPRGLYGHKVGI